MTLSPKPYWRDKVVLVTGGSAGFGKFLSEMIAAAGAKVMIASRDRSRLDQSLAELRKTSVDVEGFAADVTRDDQVAELMERTIQRFGQLDVLVNNVGRSTRGWVAATTPDAFRDMFETNFLTAVRCTQTALPHLIATRGHVVLMGSLASKVAAKFLGAYPASKFALAAFAQQLRLELHTQGVHVLLVCPGPIARDDAGIRYDEQSKELPDAARSPGAGVKLARISPQSLAQQVMRACESRKPELVVPWRARLLFAIAQLWPSLGDRLIRRATE